MQEGISFDTDESRFRSYGRKRQYEFPVTAPEFVHNIAWLQVECSGSDIGVTRGCGDERSVQASRNDPDSQTEKEYSYKYKKRELDEGQEYLEGERAHATTVHLRRGTKKPTFAVGFIL